MDCNTHTHVLFRMGNDIAERSNFMINSLCDVS